MKQGHTRKACPGCGKDCRYAPRPKDGVCAECRRALDWFAKVQTENRGRVGEQRAYVVPGRSYALPYIRHDAFEDQLQNAFYAALLEVSAASPAHPQDSYQLEGAAALFEYDRREDSHNWPGARLMPPRVAKAMGALYKAIQAGMEHAYAEGKADGTNLLKRLRDGDMGVLEYEKRKATE